MKQVHTSLRAVAMLLALFIGVLAFGTTAWATVPTTVSIPVSSENRDCTVALQDKNDAVVAELPLTAGSTDSFSITFTEPGDYIYTVHVTDTDTEGVTYDKTVYAVEVVLVYDRDTSGIRYDKPMLSGFVIGTLDDSGNFTALMPKLSAVVFVHSPTAPIFTGEDEPIIIYPKPKPPTPIPTKPASTPNTGDETNQEFWKTISQASFIALIALLLLLLLEVILRRRKDRVKDIE